MSWDSTSVVTPFQRRHVAGKLTFLRRVLGGSTTVVTMFRGRHVAGKSIYFAFALRVLIFCRFLCFLCLHSIDVLRFHTLLISNRLEMASYTELLVAMCTYVFVFAFLCV